jgi:RHS repeat-associated protein
MQLLDEPTNRRVQYTYGPSGRIESRDGVPFSYDRVGRRVEDDHFTYKWDWRSRLYSVAVKAQWQDAEGNVIVPTYAGHQVWYEYDASGRLLWRKHLDPHGSLYEKRVFLWEGSCLFAEAAFTDETETSLRWRKTYLPGPQRLDDQVQVHIETFPTSDTEQPKNQTYAFIRDELGTVIALVEEVPGADPDEHPIPAARYLYTPYGDLLAVGGRTITSDVELFPGGQNLLFQGLWTDPVTGLAYARARWYDPRNTHFISEDPAGYQDSENLYQFVIGRPHAAVDPTGLTSRTDIGRERLFYTWHLGWIDLTHAVDPGNQSSLHDAWTKLSQAEAGEPVTFELSMRQGTAGSIAFKQTSISSQVEAKEAHRERANQLLFAWQRLAEEFEEFQGEGIQSNQIVTSAYGMLTGEQEKIASSFSTEDLVSDLLTFYAEVENTKIAELLTHAGRLPDEKEFSYYVWDYYLRPEAEGNRDWEPVFIDPYQILDSVAANPVGRAFASEMGIDSEMYARLLDVPRYIRAYLSNFGKPYMPEYFRKYTPDSEGVSVLVQANEGRVWENLKEKAR